MDDNLNTSFRIYVDPIHKDDGMNLFTREVGNLMDDLKTVEDSYYKLRVTNEGLMEVHSAQAMMDLRAHLNEHLEFLLRMAKQISKKYDTIVAANAAQRLFIGADAATDHRTRASMISDIVAKLHQIMRDFHGLRVQMEADHRQFIESRYSAITGEKATAEAINNLIAMPAHERGVTAESQSEIRERRDTLMDIRRMLLDLHQIFLGIATPVEAHSDGNQVPGNFNARISPTASATIRGGGLQSPHAPAPAPAQPSPVVQHQIFKPVMGMAGLNDYEKETRKQANIAICITLLIVIALSVAIYFNDKEIEKYH